MPLVRPGTWVAEIQNEWRAAAKSRARRRAPRVGSEQKRRLMTRDTPSLSQRNWTRRRCQRGPHTWAARTIGKSSLYPIEAELPTNQSPLRKAVYPMEPEASDATCRSLSCDQRGKVMKLAPFQSRANDHHQRISSRASRERRMKWWPLRKSVRRRTKGRPGYTTLEA